MLRKKNFAIGLLSIFTIISITFYLHAQDQQITRENKIMIICYYESKYNQNSTNKIIELSETPQRIEFTDIIGEDHGGGTLIEGQIAEKGKVIVIKIETSIQNKECKSDTTQIHYIDSSLLPRKVPVEGVMLQGSVVIERSGE